MESDSSENMPWDHVPERAREALQKGDLGTELCGRELRMPRHQGTPDGSAPLPSTGRTAQQGPTHVPSRGETGRPQGDKKIKHLCRGT